MSLASSSFNAIDIHSGGFMLQIFYYALLQKHISTSLKGNMKQEKGVRKVILEFLH